MRFRIALTGAAAVLLAACPGPSKPTETNVHNGTKGDVKNRPHPAPKSIEEIFAVRCREGLEKARKQLPAILTIGGKRTIENTAEPFNDLLVNMESTQATAGLMQAVHPNPKVREAARSCEQDVEKFASELKLNRKLYEAFVAVDTSAADTKTKRFVAHTLRDFRRAGVDRDAKVRERLRQIDERMTKVGQQFTKNIIEDVRHIELKSVDQLAGLPEDYIKAHQPKNGIIKITTNYPDLIPFLSYAKNDELRRQLYVANKARGGEANEKVLRELLTLRAEKAKLLGFANWADYITGDKMIKSGDNAARFLDRLIKTAKKRTDRDYKELLARLRKDNKKAKRVQDWQKYYLEKKVKKESYSFDTQSVRPYLAYNQVVKGLLDITSEIYGITYEPAQNADVWHPSVKAFDVKKGGTKIGRIFLDMHPREGKYKHAAMFPIRNGVKGKQLPEGALVCNFPEGDALMEHTQVETMFHEFGHLMHHIFGGQSQHWVAQAGVSTEWDFVEAPSMMFEEWAWSHETLERFAKHHKTGAVIPKDLVDRMRRAKKFGVGLFVTGQTFYATVSLEFHRADPKTLDMNGKVRELQGKLTPFPFVEGTRFHANFGHLNGYSAIYYTYMWSLVIAKDLLTPFHEHGLLNKTWTQRYRDRVLAPGGSKDAADLVKDFLGREYSFKAFEDYLAK
jgi:thimet oligopeptidase